MPSVDQLIILGDKVIPPLLGNPCNGYINPYYKVDEFIPTIGKQWDFRPQHIFAHAKFKMEAEHDGFKGILFWQS